MELKKEPFLSCYLDIGEKIAEYDGKIRRMEDVAYDPPDGLPAARKEKPRGDGQKKVVNEKVTLEEKRRKLCQEQATVKKVVVAAINAVGDERMERLLYARYIEGKSIYEISVEERISYSHCGNLLREGSERVEKNAE